MGIPYVMLHMKVHGTPRAHNGWHLSHMWEPQVLGGRNAQFQLTKGSQPRDAETRGKEEDWGQSWEAGPLKELHSGSFSRCETKAGGQGLSALTARSLLGAGVWPEKHLCWQECRSGLQAGSFLWVSLLASAEAWVPWGQHLNPAGSRMCCQYLIHTGPGTLWRGLLYALWFQCPLREGASLGGIIPALSPVLQPPHSSHPVTIDSHN